MKRRLTLTVVSLLLLTSCQTNSETKEPTKVQAQEPEVLIEGPLSVEILSVRLTKTESKIPGSTAIEATVRFANIGKKLAAILRHTSLNLQISNAEAKELKPFVVTKEKILTPLDVIQIAPQEDMTVKVLADCYKLEELGPAPQVRLRASTWTLDQLEHKGRYVPKIQTWPQKLFQSKPLPILMKNPDSVVKPNGKVSLKFLNAATKLDENFGQPGTAILAKYRVYNDSSEPILMNEDPIDFDPVVSDSNRSYESIAARMELIGPTIWNLNMIFPGEVRTEITGFLPYQDKRIENVFDFQYQLSTWQLKHIDRIPQSLVDKQIKTFPDKAIKSPLYALDRRH